MTGHIDLNSNELGTYVYDLSLKATQAGPEKALYFRTCLGQNQIQVAKFLNYAKQAKADYTCKVRIYYFSYPEHLCQWNFIEIQ